MLLVPFNILTEVTRKLKIVSVGLICDLPSSFRQHWFLLLVYETKSTDIQQEEKHGLPRPRFFLPPPTFTPEKKCNRCWQRALWSALTQPMVLSLHDVNGSLFLP